MKGLADVMVSLSLSFSLINSNYTREREKFYIFFKLSYYIIGLRC